MKDKLKELYTAGEFDRFLTTAINETVQTRAAISIAEQAAQNAIERKVAVLILHPETGVRFREGLGYSPKTQSVEVLVDKNNIFADSLHELMEYRNHTAFEETTSIKRYYIWPIEASHIKEISGKTIDELIAQQKPARPARTAANLAAPAAAPAG